MTTGRRLATGQPSRTAFGAAMHRARHQVLDRPPVFVDPLAMRIIGSGPAAVIRAGEPTEDQPLRRALRASIAVRSTIAEEALAGAVERGVRQCVVLGAGLDTLAYRAILPADVHVHEVDHPATQAWKRELLRDAGIPEPTTVSYLGVDFETQTLADVLDASSIDPARPIFVTWLGVTPYLTRAAIGATLRTVAVWPGGSDVVFDYGAIPDAASETQLTVEQRAVVTAMMDRLTAIGEPWITFFAPEELAAELRAAGYTTIDDLDGAVINERYFAGRPDGLHVGRLSHVVHARRAVMDT